MEVINMKKNIEHEKNIENLRIMSTNILENIYCNIDENLSQEETNILLSFIIKRMISDLNESLNGLFLYSDK